MFCLILTEIEYAVHITQFVSSRGQLNKLIFFLVFLNENCFHAFVIRKIFLWEQECGPQDIIQSSHRQFYFNRPCFCLFNYLISFL